MEGGYGVQMVVSFVAYERAMMGKQATAGHMAGGNDTRIGYSRQTLYAVKRGEVALTTRRPPGS